MVAELVGGRAPRLLEKAQSRRVKRPATEHDTAPRDCLIGVRDPANTFLQSNEPVVFGIRENLDIGLQAPVPETTTDLISDEDGV